MHTKFDRRGADKIQKNLCWRAYRVAAVQRAEKSALYFFIYMLDKIMLTYYNVITMTEGDIKNGKRNVTEGNEEVL